MNLEECIRQGDLEKAREALRDAIKKNPADGKLRIALFQLLSVNGEWEKALTQLDLIADICPDPDSKLLPQIFRPVIQGEVHRAEVFAGKRGPLIFGEPEEWVAMLVHANTLLTSGQLGEARRVVDRAFEMAPAIAGRINEREFAWLMDADRRLGPVLEAVIDGKYFWVPMHRIAALHFVRPTDLRDLIWAPTTFVWANGGESSGFLPVRYPGSEISSDSAVRLSRKTEWKDIGEGFHLGQGQRLFATDVDDFPLLETSVVKFHHGSQ